MRYRNPVPTVDAIIRDESGGILLVLRRNPPEGWALPGGFVDYGESLEEAVKREIKEETSLDIEPVRQFHAYSDPSRDQRLHTISVVFIAKITGGSLRAGDDARNAAFFDQASLPGKIAFDHRAIIDDFFSGRY